MSGMPRIMGGVGSEPMMGARGGRDCDKIEVFSPSAPGPRALPPGLAIVIGFDFTVGEGSAAAGAVGKPRPDMWGNTVGKRGECLFCDRLSRCGLTASQNIF